MQHTTPGESKRRNPGRGIAVLALAGCLLAPGLAQAQDKDMGGNGGDSSAKTGNGAAGLADKKVTVDADGVKLAEALPPLMKSVGADFVVDNSLKDVTVSVHLSNVRFQAALDTLVKVCSQPVMYKLVDGVYHFLPRVDEPEPPRAEPPPSWPRGPAYKLGKIVVQNSDAQELVDFLSGNWDGTDSAPSSLSINGNVSGFRSYSSSGFVTAGPSAAAIARPLPTTTTMVLATALTAAARQAAEESRSGSSAIAPAEASPSAGGASAEVADLGANAIIDFSNKGRTNRTGC